jgi:hypothetical protein
MNRRRVQQELIEADNEKQKEAIEAEESELTTKRRKTK